MSRQITFLLFASLALFGCPNPNTYQTPRTLPAGKSQGTFAWEGIYVNGNTPVVSGGGVTTIKREHVSVVMLPTVQYRRGLLDSLDVGGRVTNVYGLGADFKWNFLRGRIDMAIDPGAQLTGPSSGFSVLYLHAPLLVGFNATDDVTFVVTHGVAYARETGQSAADQPYAIVRDRALFARLGIGLNVRMERKYAIMPEITIMRAVNDADGFIVVAGVGASAQPK